MRLLISLAIAAGFLVLACLCLVTLIVDLLEVSFHGSPEMPEAPGNPAKAPEYDSNSAELGDMQ
jgi:hypothetical protein